MSIAFTDNEKNVLEERASNTETKPCYNAELLNKTTEEIIDAVSGLRYFFDTTIKVANLRGKAIGPIVIVGDESNLADVVIDKYTKLMGTFTISTRTKGLVKPGDLVALLTNLLEGDTFFVKHDGWIGNSKNNAMEIFPMAIGNHALDLVIGKGPSANSIHLDLPDSNYIFSTAEPDDFIKEIMTKADFVFDFNSVPAELKYKYALLQCAENEELVIEENALTKLVELLCAGRGTAKEYIQKIFNYIYLNGLNNEITAEVIADVLLS